MLQGMNTNVGLALARHVEFQTQIKANRVNEK